MHIQIDHSRLLEILSATQSITNRRGEMPILAYVLLTAKADLLVVSATNMRISLEVEIPCQVHAVGSVAINAKNLYNMVRTLPPGAMTIKSLDNTWAQVLAARSEFRVSGLSEGDFPDLPDPAKAVFSSVPGHVLAALIDHTLFSVSTDEARVNLNGGLFMSDGATASMVSTDGHRLSAYSRSWSGPSIRNILIPRHGLVEMRKLVSKVDSAALAVLGSDLFLRHDGMTLSVSLSDSTFPPWQQVIPKSHDRTVSVGRLELVAALRQADVIAPEKTNTIKLEVGQGALTISADTPDKGSTKIEVPADLRMGTPMSIGLNATYMLEALGAMLSERVTLRFESELDPCVMIPEAGAGGEVEAGAGGEVEDFTAVVMPLRI